MLGDVGMDARASTGLLACDAKLVHACVARRTMVLGPENHC